MQSNLFTELSVEQQEVVVGGESIYGYDSASFSFNSASLFQGASAGFGGANTYGNATASSINTFANKTTEINRPYYYYPFPI